MLFDWEVIAPMVVGSLLILSIAGVILLRPISKRLGDVLEAYAKEKDAGTTRELRQIRELFETMDQRLRLMEERQDFTEKMLDSVSRERIPEPRQDQELDRPS
jgi:hypothetical protein